MHPRLNLRVLKPFTHPIEKSNLPDFEFVSIEIERAWNHPDIDSRHKRLGVSVASIYSISELFVWDSSPQGGNFWARISGWEIDRAKELL